MGGRRCVAAEETRSNRTEEDRGLNYIKQQKEWETGDKLSRLQGRHDVQYRYISDRLINEQAMCGTLLKLHIREYIFPPC